MNAAPSSVARHARVFGPPERGTRAYPDRLSGASALLRLQRDLDHGLRAPTLRIRSQPELAAHVRDQGVHDGQAEAARLPMRFLVNIPCGWLPLMDSRCDRAN